MDNTQIELHGAPMPEDWTEKRINEARAGLELLDDSACKEIGDLLNGRLSEKELRPKELAEIANTILEQVLGNGDKNAQ